MKRKMMWRYYCDFCGKGGCGASAMSQHEKRCTLNPNRVCGFHINLKIIDEPQVPIEELRAILGTYPGGGFEDSEEDAKLVDELIDAANGCPACVLAAIRQENATRKPADEIFPFAFNYKRETERAFADAKERWNGEDQYDACYH